MMWWSENPGIMGVFRGREHDAPSLALQTILL